MQTAQKAGSAIFDIGKMIAMRVATLATAAAQGIATAATTAWATATGVLNALFVATPIGWIVLAIGALIATIVICVKNWDKITAAMQITWDWVGKNTEKVLALITIFTGPFGFIISIIKELKDNWGSVVEAFKADGIIGALKKIGGIILSAVLAPIQGFLEILAKIPGVDKLLGPAVEKIKSFRESLKGNETITAEVETIVPPAINNAATATTTSGVSAVSPGIRTASAQATTPMPAAQQQALYSRSESRETVDIYVRPEQGAAARMRGRPAQSANVRMTPSGNN
jgi:hypothetical protein